MAAANEYVSQETLEQVSTESFAQNLSSFRSLLLQWEKEVEAGGATDARARVLFREAAMLQEIIQGQMVGKGRELGVPPEAVKEVEGIYRRALNKLALRIAADSKIVNPEMDRFISGIEGNPSPPAQMKELAAKLKLARTAYETILSSPNAAPLVAPTFVKLLEEIVALYRELGGTIPTAAPPAEPPKPPPSDGGGDSGSDLPRRVDRLESKVDKMADDIGEIKVRLGRIEERLGQTATKADIARLDGRIEQMVEQLKHMPNRAEMYLAAGLALSMMLGVMAKGFGWL